MCAKEVCSYTFHLDLLQVQGIIVSWKKHDEFKNDECELLKEGNKDNIEFIYVVFNKYFTLEIHKCVFG